MKAIISDIHSNLAALEAVLADIRSLGIQEIVCLGDVVGYGPDPEACIDLLKDLPVALLGNHDEAVLLGEASDFNLRARRAVEWTRRRLNDNIQNDPIKMERWNFLERMETLRQEGDVTYVHGSPRNPTKEYVFPRDAANPAKMQDIFNRFPGICFGGHTHLPGVFTPAGEFLTPEDLNNVYIRDGQKALVNIGSVGQPRDGDVRACYATFDGETVVWRRVEYDAQQTAQKIYAIEDLDRSLGDRLLKGR